MKQQRTAWRWMVALTAVALAIFSIGRAEYTPSAIEVSAWQITGQTVTQTVVCTGVLQAAKGTAVTTEVPCVIGAIAVKAGDCVKKGDVLLTVDHSATLSKAMELGLSGGEQMASAALPDCVTAPEDGIVSDVSVETGEWSDGSTACVTLSGGDVSEVAITVSEQALADVKEGQAVRVSGVALAKDYYNGQLTHLDSSAHRAVSGNGSRTVVDGIVSIASEELDPSLLAGLTAKAVITVDTREKAMVIPYEAAVERSASTAVVYCLHGTCAYRRTVTVAGETARGLEIADGLSMGEWIVADADGMTGDDVAVTVEAVVCRS